MKRFPIHSILGLLIILSTGCLRLDDNLYNNINDIDAYYLDAYTGESEIYLDASYDLPAESIHLFTLTSNDNGDKATIYAVYIGDLDSIATDTVILYCHGNFGHMDFYWERAKLLANVGSKNQYGVLMMDYRGFGLSEGKPTESGMYADVDACMQWLQDNGLTNDRLIMYGFSLGSAPATELTARPRTLTPNWLILENPFASAAVMVQDGSGLALPASYFTNLKIDVAEDIKLVDQPFLWMHGVDDDFLAMKTHGEVVYANYGGQRSTAYRVPHAGHGDLPVAMGFDAYVDAIYLFLQDN